MKENDNTQDSRNDEDSYKRACSIGYILAQVEPAFVKEMTEINLDLPILNGLRAGRDAFIQEKAQRDDGLQPEWLQRDVVTKSFNERSVEPDRSGDLEHDR